MKSFSGLSNIGHLDRGRHRAAGTDHA